MYKLFLVMKKSHSFPYYMFMLSIKKILQIAFDLSADMTTILSFIQNKNILK